MSHRFRFKLNSNDMITKPVKDIEEMPIKSDSKTKHF